MSVSPASPADYARLGWLLGEVHGRYRTLSATDSEAVRTRIKGLMPLTSGLSAPELAIRARAHLGEAAEAAGCDFNISDLSELRDDATGTVNEYLETLSKGISEKRAAPTDVIHALESWNRTILDRLDDTSAGAYELGRALAECYWSAVPPDAVSASLVFGPERVDELRGLVDDAGTWLSSVTRSALTASLEGWRAWVTGKGPLARGELQCLREQYRVWRRLVVEGHDAKELVTARQLVDRAKNDQEVLKAYAAPAWLALGGLVGLALFSAFIASGSISHWVTALVGVVGVTGISAAGVQARVKTVVQGLGQHLRDAVYADAAAVAVTRLPDEPNK